MARNRRTKHGILMVAALGILTVAGLALAHAPKYGPRSQLTDEQARQLEELRGGYEAKMLPLEKQIAAAEVELDRKLTRPGADSDQIGALRREMRDLEGQLEDLYAQANVDAAEVLGIPPGAAYQGNWNWLAHDAGADWCGTCRRDHTCRWDAARFSGSRMSRWSRWWQPDSWMDHNDQWSRRGGCR